MSDDALYEGLDEATPPDPVQAALAKIEAAEAIALQEPDPINFDVDGLAPADDAPVLIFGAPGALKTWLVLDLCDAMVRGRPFLGFETRQRPSALFLNLDAGAKTFRNRVRSVSDAPGFDVLSLSASEFSNDVLRAVMERYAGGFVAIDCLSSIYAPDMKKDPASAMRTFVDNIRALYARHGCGGVIIDHPHRPKERGEIGDYFGSVQKEAAFRSMWSVVASPVDDTEEGQRAPRRVKISCRKLSEGQPFRPIEVDVDFRGERVTIARVEADQRPPDVRAAIVEEKLLQWGRKQIKAFSKASVVDAIHGHRATAIRAAFITLVERGAFVETGVTRGGGMTYRAVASSSGTNSDEADQVGSTSQSRTRSPYGDRDGLGLPEVAS